MNKGERLTPRRGRSREDVKQIKIPDHVHRMLYVFAHANNMTFGDAAATLIRDSIEDLFEASPESTTNAAPFSGKRVQIKVPKEAHLALYAFAIERGMTIGDAAALLIGVSLTKLYGLDEDEATRKRRAYPKKQWRRLDLKAKGITPKKRRMLQERVSRAVNKEFDELIDEMRRT